uniref:Uncharacterized protein n=1 Tax=Anguilla anguilla TaxID=7936 RepID=A0A0E9QE62_ANGAN
MYSLQYINVCRAYVTGGCRVEHKFKQWIIEGQ